MATTDVTATSSQAPGLPPALPAAGKSTAPSLKMRVVGWRLTVEDACRRQPAETLAIALAAGFGLGRLLRFALAWTRSPEPIRRQRWTKA